MAQPHYTQLLSIVGPGPQEGVDVHFVSANASPAFTAASAEIVL
jgi:hypothetical protein